MHSNFQMDISLTWIDAALTQHLKLYLNYLSFTPVNFSNHLQRNYDKKSPGVNHFGLLHYVKWDRIVTLRGAQAD
jgi:hypothetical protein